MFNFSVPFLQYSTNPPSFNMSYLLNLSGFFSFVKIFCLPMRRTFILAQYNFLDHDQGYDSWVAFFVVMHNLIGWNLLLDMTHFKLLVSRKSQASQKVRELTEMSLAACWYFFLWLRTLCIWKRHNKVHWFS